MDVTMITALTGILGVVIGTFGTKVVDAFLSKKKMSLDLAAQIRSEQRAEVLTLRSELTGTEKEVDEWREKYFELKEENARQQIMLDHLQHEVDEIKNVQ